MPSTPMRELEDKNLKLKKQLEDTTDKLERLKTKWESKIESQKKEITSLTSEVSDLKSQMVQQKTKHQKEMAKGKEAINKMERDMRNLKRGIDNVEKEKSQLKDKLHRNIPSNASGGRNRYKARLDLSKDMNRSCNDLELYSKRKSCKPASKGNNSSFFERKNSASNKRDNFLFSSTTSLKSFNLLKSCKNISKKINEPKK